MPLHDLVIRNGRVIDGTGRPSFGADVAIRGSKIVEVGPKVGRGHRELDADGLAVTPGFVDVHTHYDGQATWDPELAPSCWHGVTTVVMGNCGVGFAPVRNDQHDFMVRVMEGVEEIPGSALREGIPWTWETFPEYLDVLEGMHRTIDVATQVPHCALRCYVMGEARALDDVATSADIERMQALTREALQAGALGFSTSRTLLHRVKGGGPMPGTHSDPQELLGIAQGVRDAGHGVFQMMSDTMGGEPDFAWMKAIARCTGGPLLFTLAQLPDAPRAYRAVLETLREAEAHEDLDIRAAVPWRPPGVLLGLQATLNPLCTHPSFEPLRERPLAERVAALRDPGLRERIAAERPKTRNPLLLEILTNAQRLFPLGDPPDYEPAADQSIAAQARRSSRTIVDVLIDRLLDNDGHAFLYHPLASYVDRDFEALREMLQHPRSVASLSDGGAHVGTVCDASVTTYMMSHWARDRSRGPRLAVEDVIRKQTLDTAALYGLLDRGTIEVGKKADLNLVNLETLRIDAPVAAFDLPKGGRRLVQRAHGYRATIVSGALIAENDELTGARPGRLVRGPQA